MAGAGDARGARRAAQRRRAGDAASSRPSRCGGAGGGAGGARAGVADGRRRRVDAIADWADAMLIGPGLGGEGARAMVERLLGAFDGPVVLDADALNAFAGDVAVARAR